jgi:putative ABC transport system permease protein
MGLSLDIASGMEKSTPFDASLVVRGALDESDTPLAPIQGYDLATDAKDVGLDNFAKDYLAVRYYQSDLVVPLTVFENNIKQEYNMQSYFLKLSDYNAILKRAGAAPIALAPGEYAVNSEVTNEAFHTAVADYMKNPEEIELNGAKLRSSSQNFYTNFMETSRYQDYNMTMIVPDEFVKDLPVVQNVLHINYPEQTAEYDALCKEGLSKLQFDRGVQAVTQTRSEVTEVGDSATTIIIYLGVYLGIIFLIAAAAVLAIGQLSETSDNVSRYSLLRKIGADEKMINRAMFSQILIYFGAPMILAIVHSMVGIPVAGQIVSAFDKGNIFGGSLFTACVLLVIYGGYFWSTYQGSKRILNRDYR